MWHESGTITQPYNCAFNTDVVGKNKTIWLRDIKHKLNALTYHQ